MINYNVTLEVLTPVHIGNGNNYTKKEYAISGNYANIYDPIKLYSLYSNTYESFLLEGNQTLTNFFKNHKNSKIDEALKYRVICGGAEVSDRDGIDEFVKDPYGCPYIPGSSLKGVVRTACLSGIVKKKEDKPDRYSEYRSRPIDKRGTNIDSIVFGEPERSKFKHIKVSDSKPLSTNDLVLSKKIDVFLDGKKNELNICRESLKVGTKINFTLTIDDANDSDWQKPWTPNQLMSSIKVFARQYRESFLSKFSHPAPKDIYGDDIIYLGGGTGFPTKTVDYALYGEDAVDKISEYLASEFRDKKGPDMHDHKKDKELGVSPHMMKCTMSNNKLVEMGICRIRID